jgi:hypothetical protein
VVVEYKKSTIPAVREKIKMEYDEENFSTCGISYGKFYRLFFGRAGYQFYNLNCSMGPGHNDRLC